MDKYPVYSGSIPLDTNILQPQRATEIALGFLLQAAFGTGTVIDGLAVTQTVTPSMGVLVGPGSIIVSTTVDTVVAGFGSLPVNAAPLNKIGINLTPTTLTTLTAPGTAGQSQNTLVEAQFLEVDGSPVVLPYYNSANPSIPFTGPANAGTPNNTARTNTVQLQYKQGVAAATGSQLTPAPDAGWTGVAVVTIANGQSSILNANITRYVNAPIVPTKLPNLRIKLTAALSLYVAANGNDLNSGLSAAVPFATLQAAWNAIVNNYDLAGYNVTVNVANGTYTAGLVASGIVTGLGSGNLVLFNGNSGAPSNVVLTVSNAHAVLVSNGAAIGIAGFSLAASGTTGGTAAAGLVSAAGGVVSITSSMVFNTCSGPQIWATATGTVGATSVSWTVAGGALCHIEAAAGAFINLTSCTVTVSGAQTFSGEFAFATLLGTIQTVGSTFTGASAIGSRYLTSLNGVITTGGGGPTFFPGNVAGSSVTGGQYN